MKPGFPLMLAKLNGALVFALPGNPVSSFATFSQLVLPALRELEGESATTPLQFEARIDQKLSKSHRVFDKMAAIRHISPHQAKALQDQGAVLLDVRTPAEWQTGLATEAAVVAGGMRAWRNSDLPLCQPAFDEAAVRYDRHLRLPQWGHDTQQKLAKAHVLMIGAGGLGSPAALYLAAAGVGQLTIIDNDRVDLSNLQRQVLHCTEAIGQPKVDSARERLHSLNPLINVHAIHRAIGPDNVEPLVHQADVVIDGSDNLATRYLVNQICHKNATPLVYAAVYQFEGQVASFDFRQEESPCYACLFPQSQAEEPPNCARVGVLGVVPGLAGTLQAGEAIKLITGLGQTLNGQLLTFDLLDNRFRRLSLKKDPRCAVCSTRDTERQD